jgi:hypothetical protein
MASAAYFQSSPVDAATLRERPQYTSLDSALPIKTAAADYDNGDYDSGLSIIARRSRPILAELRARVALGGGRAIFMSNRAAGHAPRHDEYRNYQSDDSFHTSIVPAPDSRR